MYESVVMYLSLIVQALSSNHSVFFLSSTFINISLVFSCINLLMTSCQNATVIFVFKIGIIMITIPGKSIYSLFPTPERLTKSQIRKSGAVLWNSLHDHIKHYVLLKSSKQQLFLTLQTFKVGF